MTEQGSILRRRLRTRQKRGEDVNPGLWKLVVAAFSILVIVFAAMELVEDTYMLPSQTKLSAPSGDGAG